MLLKRRHQTITTTFSAMFFFVQGFASAGFAEPVRVETYKLF